MVFATVWRTGADSVLATFGAAHLRFGAMTDAALPRRFGQTTRRDAWWAWPAVVLVILLGFIVYATWAAFQDAHYTYGPYLSPFYSPELFGSSPHAWFGPKPEAWPSWLPFSPALLILGFPAGFRFTCYYYRGAYYKAFWADPPACAVGEPRKSYRGESAFPLILQTSTAIFSTLRSSSSSSFFMTSGRPCGSRTRAVRCISGWASGRW